MGDQLWRRLRHSPMFTCASCRQATSVRRFENGGYYCMPCGERIARDLHIRPVAQARSK